MIPVKTNVDAYNLLVGLCNHGYRQDIQRGSFAGEESVYRMQAQPVMIEIIDPLNFLYLPKEVTLGIIEKYYDEYIVNETVQDNETYTYGSRICDQIGKISFMLSETPQTNQASISVSQPSDIFLEHPPCLREIAFNVFDDRLNMTTYWRSNDIGSAYLINQGGMALLLKDIAEFAELEIGSHFYVCTAPHLYVRRGGND